MTARITASKLLGVICSGSLLSQREHTQSCGAFKGLIRLDKIPNLSFFCTSTETFNSSFLQRLLFAIIYSFCKIFNVYPGEGKETRKAL